MSSCHCLTDSCLALLRGQNILKFNSLPSSVQQIIGGSQHKHRWSELHFRESRCWTFALSDLLWRCACQNVKTMWLLVCLVWLLEWLPWNNVTHLFSISLFSTETSGVVFMVTGHGQKTNSVLDSPLLTRTLWVDGLTKNGNADSKNQKNKLSVKHISMAGQNLIISVLEARKSWQNWNK